MLGEYSSVSVPATLKLFGPDTFLWGGGLPREGAGAKGLLCPLKPRDNEPYGGLSDRYLGGSDQNFENKRFVFKFVGPKKRWP